jgi:glycosyltransferase involved in cell wall biosynthesis
MKIVMFSINPIFPDKVTGGASKHLYHIARHLGGLGHNVEILCAKPQKELSPFTWAKNVTVFPDLPFNIPFPQPYNISGPDLSLIIHRLSDALKGADRFYIHDGEFLIPDVYQSIPTIVSFRDNIYPESVMGTFIGKADDVICVSDYSKNVIQFTAGLFFPDLINRLHQVNNGIDFYHFKPVDPKPLAHELGIDLDEETVLLHPHRPEPGKGLPETIMVVDRLVHQHSLSNIRVLIPEWIDSMLSAGDSDFYVEMMHLIQDLGVQDNFQFIPWLPIRRMPALYSLGAVTLCLGSIVEAFGNVAYESMACGTPSIVARVSVHRTMMSDDLIAKVNFGDIEGAVEKIISILTAQDKVRQKALEYLQDGMDINHQVQAYADIILSCQKRDKLQFERLITSDDQVYKLAPWCYIDGDRIYHDFHGVFENAMKLAELLSIKESISKLEAEQAGVAEGTWQDWLDRTWIVPIS